MIQEHNHSHGEELTPSPSGEQTDLSNGQIRTRRNLLEDGSVVIVDGLRTPFSKAFTDLKDQKPLQLLTHVLDGLIEKLASNGSFSPDEIEEVIIGQVTISPQESNLARLAVLTSEYLKDTTTAYTVSEACISSCRAIHHGALEIASGAKDFVIAGGVESMSNTPLLMKPEAQSLFRDLATAKGPVDSLRSFVRWRLGMAFPQQPALKNPITGLSMGEHCELMAQDWEIGRAEQDQLALDSHKNAAAARNSGKLAEQILPVGKVEHDNLIRENTSLERLAKLKPVFDKSESGTITAGTSSPLTDGAAVVALAHKDVAAAHGIEPKASIIYSKFAAVSPDDGLLMGTAVAVYEALQQTGLSLKDIDVIELHEPFAAQVLCVVKALELGWPKYSMDKMEDDILNAVKDKLNTWGGAIAVGHPLGASGARQLFTCAARMGEVVKDGPVYGLSGICADGGEAHVSILRKG